MNYNRRKKYNDLLMMLGALLILMCLPVLVHAQVDPAGDPDAPIDGGLGFLLAAGIGYGVKKVRDYKKIKQL